MNDSCAVVGAVDTHFQQGVVIAAGCFSQFDNLRNSDFNLKLDHQNYENHD
jgi:hypothetical protein